MFSLSICFRVLSWLSVSMSSNLFSVCISYGLCLLVSFFQGDFFLGG